jgi:hypothetical protein
MEKEEINKIENPCCTADSICCGSVETSTSDAPTNMVSKNELDPNRLNVDIYVPLNACACEWSQFMNLIFSAITPHMKYIKHETKNLNSEEARKLGLRSKCVLVDGAKKYTTSYALKKDLPNLLKEKGLIK